MAAQKEAPAGSRQPPSRSGASSRNSTGTSVASSSARGNKSPGPTRPGPAGRSAAGGSGGGTAATAAGTPPSRTSQGTTRAAGAAAAAAATASTVLYRYLVLPGNESVLLREALERRPWWQPVVAAPGSSRNMRKDGGAVAAGASAAAAAAGAGAGAEQQRWNLWAGLNGQRFTQFDLLQPGSAGAAAGTEPASRRLVNRLPEHRLICTKSGLAGVLASLKAAATASVAAAAAAGGGGSDSGSGGDAAASATAAGALAGASAAGSGPGSGAAKAGESKSDLDLSWIPETYVVPAGPKAVAAGGGGGGGGALGRFKAAFARHAAAGRRVWIAKPTCLNRGNGIEVYDSLDRILDHIKSRPPGSSLILQKYIERPLLLGGRKFDIRAYALVGHDGSVWFHKEAYCRTSSTPYDCNDLSNRSSHLTNDAVQKHLDTYNAFEDHCKMSLQELGPALRRRVFGAVPAGHHPRLRNRVVGCHAPLRGGSVLRRRAAVAAGFEPPAAGPLL